MIDYLTLALTHGLIALALWRLAFRPELDEEGAAASPVRKPWLKGAGSGNGKVPEDD